MVKPTSRSKTGATRVWPSSQLGRLHIILARRRRGRWWYGGHLFIGYIIYIYRERDISDLSFTYARIRKETWFCMDGV